MLLHQTKHSSALSTRNLQTVPPPLPIQAHTRKQQNSHSSGAAQVQLAVPDAKHTRQNSTKYTQYPIWQPDVLYCSFITTAVTSSVLPAAWAALQSSVAMSSGSAADAALQMSMICWLVSPPPPPRSSFAKRPSEHTTTCTPQAASASSSLLVIESSKQQLRGPTQRFGSRCWMHNVCRQATCRAAGNSCFGDAGPLLVLARGDHSGLRGLWANSGMLSAKHREPTVRCV